MGLTLGNSAESGCQFNTEAFTDLKLDDLSLNNVTEDALMSSTIDFQWAWDPEEDWKAIQARNEKMLAENENYQKIKESLMFQGNEPLENTNLEGMITFLEKKWKELGLKDVPNWYTEEETSRYVIEWGWSKLKFHTSLLNKDLGREAIANMVWTMIIGELDSQNNTDNAS